MDSSAMLCRDTYTEQNIQSHTHISCRRVHYSTRPCFVCNLTSVLIPVQSSSIQDWAEFWESHLGSYQSTVASFPRVELHGAASVVLNFIQGASCWSRANMSLRTVSMLCTLFNQEFFHQLRTHSTPKSQPDKALQILQRHYPRNLHFSVIAFIKQAGF